MSSSNGHSAPDYIANGDALYGPENDSAFGPPFWDQLRTFWKGKWLILGLALILGGTAFLYFQSQPKQYQTDAALLLNESEGPERLEEFMPSRSTNRMDRELYFLRNSQVFAREVAEVLANRADSLSPGEKGSYLWTSTGEVRSLDALARQVQKALTVQRGTRDVPAIRFQATSSHPEEAALLANTYTEVYQAHLHRSSSARLRTSRQFLERQRDKLQNRLRAIEDTIAAHVRAHGQSGHLSPADSGLGIVGEASQIASQISELRVQKDQIQLELNMERALLDSTRARLRRIRPNLADRAASTTPERLQKTHQEIASLEAELQTIQARNETLRPSMEAQLQDKKERIDQLRTQSEQLAQQYIDQALSTDAIDPLGEGGDLSSVVNLQRDITRHQINITRLQAKLETINERLTDRQVAMQNAPDRTLARLHRQKNTTKELFLSLSKSLQKAQVSEESTPEQASIIKKAPVPTAPIGPDVWSNVLLATLLGGVAGMLIVGVYDKLDDIADDPKELERRGYELFGVIPSWDADPALSSPAETNASEWVGLPSPFSPAAEAYRHVATNIRLGVPHAVNVLLVTSPGIREGKTTTTANLGVALTEAGRDVLLIDADLQGPNLHRLFDKERVPGLTDALSEAYDAVQVLREPKRVGHMQPPGHSSTNQISQHEAKRTGRLGLLPAGTSIPQPALLLQDKHVQPLLEELGETWDTIVIDTPPSLVYDDATRLASLSDLVLLIAAAGKTRISAYSEVKNRLERLASQTTVGLLNQYVPSRQEIYGYRYYSYSAAHPERKRDQLLRQIHRGFRHLVKN